MVFATVILSSGEWCKLRDAARKQFPGEKLAQGEILRRYALAGIEKTRNLRAEDQRRPQYQSQATQTVAGPEGEQPRLIGRRVKPGLIESVWISPQAVAKVL
jgi:hypothetical protein